MPNRTNTTTHTEVDTASIIIDRRVGVYWERAAIALIFVVMSFTVWAFQEQGKRLENLESKIIALDKIKVDKADLKDVEERLNSKMDGLKTDILSRQDIMQSNILARLDLYFKTSK